MSQKIKLKNGTEIAIQVINSSFEIIGENDRRDTLFIYIPSSIIINPEYLKETMFSNTSVLDSIEIWGEFDKIDTEGNVVIDETSNLPIKEWKMQGTHERYNLPCSITQNLMNNLIEIKIARKSTLEQQLLETQLALAELGTLIGGTK